ncbi:MAG: phosphoribosylglycinamide formyltransferase [Gemmatimonadales bacterium]
MRVAVLASGSGTNLQSLIQRCRAPAPVQIALVASNRPDAGALQRAREAGISSHVLADPADGQSLLTTLEECDIDLVVLAGYLKLVPQDVVVRFAGRMINIHPALLPSFGGAGMYGSKVHDAVIRSGATVTGVTVHLVSEEYDRGPIVAQWPVPVSSDDTPETLGRRVLAVEHQILPEVVINAARAGGVTRMFPTSDSWEEVAICPAH